MAKKYLAYGLIPARGGSRGLPGKNLKLLNGRPLVAYMIQAAFAAETLDVVYVSTEDEKIARIAQKHGAEVILHPAKLSVAVAPTFGVIQNAAKVFREKGTYPDIIATLRATSPLCLRDDIEQAIRMLIRHPKADSVISVVRSDIHPFRVLRINRRGELEHFDKRSPEKNFPGRRQSFGDVYIRNGAIYATRTSVIESGSLWGSHCLPFIMPKKRSVNINDAVDFLLAETLMKHKAS